MTTTTTRTCDGCDKAIEWETVVVELGFSGLALHPGCFTALSGAEVLHLIGEDTTTLRLADGTAIRARDARIIQADGTITGKPEYVPW